MIYTLGRDKEFRPVVIVDIAKINQNTGNFEKIIDSCHFLFDYIKLNLLVPGKIESWIIIIDCRGVSSGDISKRKINQLAKDMGKLYPCRLEAMYIIQLPKFLQILWKFIMIFMDKSTSDKIKILGSNFSEVIREKIDLSQLENKFGGLLRDMIRQFFPPRTRL